MLNLKNRWTNNILILVKMKRSQIIVCPKYVFLIVSKFYFLFITIQKHFIKEIFGNNFLSHQCMLFVSMSHGLSEKKNTIYTHARVCL